MPKVNVNGIETNYLFFGNSSKIKPIVIFIHGAGQSSKSWEFQYNFCKLYARFSFIVIDLPGHGESDGSGFTSIKEYSRFLNNFINKLELKEIVLVGHSMGGCISQLFITERNKHVIGSVLAGTGIEIRVTRATFEAAKNDFEKFSRLAAQNSFSKYAPKKLREKFHRSLSNSNQQTCINDLTACNEFDATEDLSKINSPTLIIAGEDDTLAPIKHSKHLYEQIPNSKLKTIRQSGHFMMQEKPDEFNYLLANFLNLL